jgi:hypothetical protein
MPTPGTILPILRCSRLKILNVDGYRSVDLTGLTSLTHFRWYGDCSVNGKELIYPQLTSFKGDYISPKDMALLQNVKSFHADSPVYADIRKCSPHVSSLQVKRDKESAYRYFIINEELKELTLHSYVVDTSSSNLFSSLRSLSLTETYVRDFSAFPNIEKITITKCLGVSDISCLRKVPYLNLSGCTFIKDFCCLSGEYQ